MEKSDISHEVAPPSLTPPGGPAAGAPSSANIQLSYVDFIPQCIQQRALFAEPKYERFDVLVARANGWLANNPGFKVRSCESLELKLGAHGVNPEQSVYMESSSMANYYIRALRLWFSSKAPGDSPEPVRLGWLTVVPSLLSPGKVFSMPEFDPFNVTLSKLNDLFKAQPLPGRIINLETQEMKLVDWAEGGVDPDESYWRESADMSTYYLMLLRVFYQASQPAMEYVGSVDIAPVTTLSGLSLTSEPFGVLAQRANQWIQEHPGIRVTNIQSINYKMESTFGGGTGYSTMRTLYRKSADMSTTYIRMIRIYYAQPSDGSSYQPQVAPPILTYRSFQPAVTCAPGKILWTMPKYESVSQNMRRVAAWLNFTGAKVLGAETVMLGVSARAVDAEATYTHSSGSMSNVWLYVIRVYLEGVYSDPPPEALPPPPDSQPANTPQTTLEIGCCRLV